MIRDGDRRVENLFNRRHKHTANRINHLSRGPPIRRLMIRNRSRRVRGSFTARTISQAPGIAQNTIYYILERTNYILSDVYVL